ncbi:MAG: DUF4833 domain-containing protein [Mucilaginibacter sp.]
MRILLLSFFLTHSLTYSPGTIKIKNTVTDSASKSSRLKYHYPVPPVNAQQLFYLQRTPNSNTIIYDLNFSNGGRLDTDEPVKAYWIRYAENGQKQDLSYIQRKFAYGITAKALNNGNYDIRFVSYKKFPLTLMKAGDGKYHIFAVIAQKQVILNRIFVKIDGGSFWLPNVSYVEVKGSDPVTGREIVERFKP